MHKVLHGRTVVLSFCAATAFFIFIPSYAYAYIDPATTSYIIQLVIGLVISLSVAFGVFFRRVQMFFVTARARISVLWVVLASKMQHSDTAAAKGVEGKSTEVESSKRRIGGAIDRKAWYEEKKRTQPKEPFHLKRWLFEEHRPFKQRLLMAVLLAGALSITYFICCPLDLFIANRQYIPYHVSIPAPFIVGSGLVAFAVMAGVMLVTRGRLFDCLASFFFGGLIMLYVQGSFLNLNLGLLTGDAIDWSRYTTWAVVDTVICLVIVAMPFGLHALSKKAWRSTLLYVSALMIVVQLISLLNTVISTDVLSNKNSLTADGPMILSDKGVFDVSRSENIIVILLDKTDAKLADQIIADDPDFFKGRFDGFTNFTNYNSFTMGTFPSVCNLLTGARYDYTTPQAEFLDTSYERATFLKDLNNAGWSNYVYTDQWYCYQDAAPLKNDVKNVVATRIAVEEFMALKKVWKLTAFRYFPHILKAPFWVMTEEFNDGVSYDSEDGQPWIGDEESDHRFYNTLLSQGLEYSVSPDEKRFTFIHLKGSHTPFTFDRNMQKVSSDQSSELLQARAAYTMTFEYLDQLKEMGLYEDATIIVTADHGNEFIVFDPPPTVSLYVKPAGSSETPMTYNNAPVTFDNFRATVMQASGADYSNYGPTYFEVSEDAVVTRPYTTCYTLLDKPEQWVFEYEITGDVKDFNNWKYIREYRYSQDE